MSSAQNHIIEKVLFEVYTRTEKKAKHINNTASKVLQENVFEALDELFGKYENDGQIFRFDSLKIDCTIQSWDNISDLKLEVIEKLEREIIQAKQNGIVNIKLDKDLCLNSKEIQKIDNRENYQSTFLFFLGNGYLPWFGKREYIDKITNPKTWSENLKQLNFSRNLKELLSENSIARERLVIQFSDEVIVFVLQVFDSFKLKDKPSFLTFLKESEPKYKEHLLELLLELLVNKVGKQANLIQFLNHEFLMSGNPIVSENFVDDTFTKLLDIADKYFTNETIAKFLKVSADEVILIKQQCIKRINGSELKKESLEFNRTSLENSPIIISQELVNSVEEKEPPYFKSGENEIAIENAGLVLFVPFVNKLFERINCINTQKRINHSDRTVAVQTLSFLANGNDDYFEGNLMFEKYLCGIPLDFPISKNCQLSDEIKDECNTLLLSLIKNWTALKNTSPNGLRQMFVQRSGKLIKTERGFRLIVERKVQDVLLDKIPWNISIVKLPWIDDLLFVEW